MSTNSQSLYVISISFFIALFFMQSASALSLAGVQVPSQQTVNGKQLKLNGAGIREKFFIKVYVGALYLPQATSNVDKAIKAAPKRMWIHFVHDKVEKKKIVEAWNEGFAANTGKDELNKLKQRIDEFNGMFTTMSKGDEIMLDYLPAKGTRVIINGKTKGIVKGDDFHQAVMRIWLGKKPVTKGLKKALLGS